MEERKGTVGYLNLIADAVHNFTDGAAVGLAFLSGGPAAGWAKTLVMLAHEVPQEIGDFGVLVGAGFSVVDALRLNFASALTAVAGTFVALVLCDDSGHGGRYSPTWIDGAVVEGFTAGGFVYVAAATMRGLGDGNGREGATVAAIFVGTFTCAAIHALGGCDHGH
jgi:zinc transporter ZupT